jgi:hypothetical protein
MTTPRKTVASLAAEMAEGFAALDQRLAEAARRHSHPDLGREIASIKRELAELRSAFATQGPNLVLAGRLDELTTTVNGMETRVNMLEDGQRSLAGRVEDGFRAASDTFDKHGRRIDALEASAKETEGRMTIVASSTARAHARIDALVPERFNWIAAGIIGGLLMALWFFWYLPADFGGQVSVNGAPTGAYVGSQADTVWGAILGLVVVFFGALSAGYLFASSGNHSANTTIPASAPADANKALPAQPAPADAPKSASGARR